MKTTKHILHFSLLFFSLACFSQTDTIKVSYGTFVGVKSDTDICALNYKDGDTVLAFKVSDDVMIYSNSLGKNVIAISKGAQVYSIVKACVLPHTSKTHFDQTWEDVFNPNNGGILTIEIIAAKAIDNSLIPIQGNLVTVYGEFLGRNKKNIKPATIAANTYKSCQVSKNPSAPVIIKN